MAEPVWGNLAKTQDNPESVDDAIAAAIAVHNADPMAHMAAGQSIDVHRANTVVDHPVGSLLADKMTNSEWTMNTVFESLDVWNIVGSVDNAGQLGVAVYVEWTPTKTSSLSANPQFVPNFFNASKDMLFQTLALWDGSNTHVNGWLGFLTTYTSTDLGFGFQIRDGVLYAHVRCGTTTSDQVLSSVDITQAHIYRAQYNAAFNSVAFYVDNVLVATITRPTGTNWADDTGPAIGLHLTQSNDGNLRVGNLLVSRQI